jgi:alcohol dehydrogenase/L-iditol 2-dehydrogenase
MKAALLVEPGRVVVTDVADPEPGPGDVRIAVGGVGLCGSDLSVYSGRWKAPSYPWTMGHEAFGVVEAVGRDVSSERLGKTVVVEPNIACFACDYCRRGWTSACSQRQSVGMNRPGALSELLVVPDQFAWSVSSASPEDLVSIEPATVVLAALRRLKVALPDAALVVGVGAQGLMMSLVLLDRDVVVYANDVNPDRVAFAGDLGALAATDHSTSRFHLVVDTVGSPTSMASALEHVEVGGTLLCLGLDARPAEFAAQTLVRRQMTLQGSLTYDHPADFEGTISLIAQGRLAPGRIITDEYPLDHAHLAFEGNDSARGKTWIRVSD